MKSRFLLVLLMGLLVCHAASAADMSAFLGDISTLKGFKAERASSCDPNLENGNGDARPIDPGKTLTLAELKGPGRITHIWFTIAQNERFYGKKLVLRMYWDGEDKPSVEVPINDFFCEGHGLDYVVDSLPFRVTSEGRARNCYFPMPFGKSARIEVENQGKQACHAFYYYIDWQKLDRLPKDTAYFHSTYRQEYPCAKGKNFLILDAVGKGHFVGCNLSVRTVEPGWWGEGDDFFYVDGEQIPSLQGTGSEDYFCDAWGLRQQHGLFYGTPIMEGYGYNKRTTSYRFHITDPVPFKKSLVMEIEHKGARQLPDGSWNGFLERFDDFSSVAYWYQTEPHKTFAPLPTAEQRIYSTGVGVIEGPSLISTAVAVNGPAPTQQDIRLFWQPTDEKASLTVKVPVEKAGKYVVTVRCTSSWDYGIYQAFLNDKPAGRRLDLFTPDVKSAPPADLGVFELPQGTFDLKFQCVGSNPESKGVYFGLEEIELTPVR